MHGGVGRIARLALAALACALIAGALAPAAGAKTKYLAVKWMKSYAAPAGPGAKWVATPEKLDRVGVIKVGSKKAKNVLVIEPGTSGGGAYFVPLAKWIVEREPGWQVWAVERRENLLEDQKEAQKFKEGKVNGTEFFNYYLGWLAPGAKVKKHYKLLTEAEAETTGA